MQYCITQYIGLEIYFEIYNAKNLQAPIIVIEHISQHRTRRFEKTIWIHNMLHNYGPAKETQNNAFGYITKQISIRKRM